MVKITDVFKCYYCKKEYNRNMMYKCYGCYISFCEECSESKALYSMSRKTPSVTEFRYICSSFKTHGDCDQPDDY